MKRPSSISEVAEWTAETAEPRAFHYHLAEFLDQFRLERRAEMLRDEPRLLANQFETGDIWDAYLAATAVSLARELGATPPAWVWNENRKLRKPWFASPGPAVRAMLLLESPAPFRERNLFVSENALSRA